MSHHYSETRQIKPHPILCRVKKITCGNHTYILQLFGDDTLMLVQVVHLTHIPQIKSTQIIKCTKELNSLQQNSSVTLHYRIAQGFHVDMKGLC